MSDSVAPRFRNDIGVSAVAVGATEFMCIGATPPFDHPHVFLDMGGDSEVICPYCSTIYRYDVSLKAREARPAECVWGAKNEMDSTAHAEVMISSQVTSTIDVQAGFAMDQVVEAEVEENDPKATKNEVKLKTREEYHLAVHDKLLEARKDATDFINIYMISCYGFLGLVILLFTNSLSKLDLAGFEIKLDQTYAPEYVVALLLLAYTLIDFHLLRMGRLFRAITRSSVELSKINPCARVVDVNDMHLFLSGIVGIMLAPARSQTNWILARLGRMPTKIFQGLLGGVVDASKTPSKRSKRWKLLATFWAFFRPMLFPWLSIPGTQLVLRFVGACFLIYLPLVATTSLVLYTKYHQIQYFELKSYLSQFASFDKALLCASVGVFLYTTYAWIVLCLSYCFDALNGLIRDFESSLEEVTTTLGLPQTTKVLGIERLRDIVHNW
jgi:uncharacterized Zn-finger protein